MTVFGPAILALGLVIGLAFPPLAAFLAPALGPLMALVLFLSVLRTDMGLVARHLRHPPVALFKAMACLFLLCPLGTALLCLILPLPPDYARAVILNSATPPILGAPAAALVLGLDMELAMFCMLGGSLLAPLSITLASWLVSGGDGGTADAAAILWRVSVLTALPVVLGSAVWRIAGPRWRGRAAESLRRLIILGLAVLAIALMDGANRALSQGYGQTAMVLAFALAFNVTNQLAFAGLARWFQPRQAGIVAIMAGNRNLGLTLAGLGDWSGPVFAAYVAMGQFPIYLTPLVWRLLRRSR